jgi:TrkA domain protein
VTTVRETQIPGVGVRYELELEGGEHIGVIVHRSGRRELMTYSTRDPDAVQWRLAMTPVESRIVGDLLGGVQLVENLVDMQQSVEGLVIDWLPLPAGSPFAGRSIGDAAVRSRTGVSIVAVIRDETAFPAPGPDFGLEADDTLVVVGTAGGIEAVGELLRRS